MCVLVMKFQNDSISLLVLSKNAPLSQSLFGLCIDELEEMVVKFVRKKAFKNLTLRM